MNPDHAFTCDGCGCDMAVMILRDLATEGQEFKVCRDCGSYYLVSDAARFQYVGELTLHNAMHSRKSQATPYDQAMADYLEGYEAEVTEQMRAGVLRSDELEKAYDMPSDAVLDAYIDSNPDKFTFDAYSGNTEEDIVLSGLATWHEMRQSAVEVSVA